MITKYDRYIKESLSSKTDIKNWLDKMNIINYTINDDLTVDVDGNVNIGDENLKKIPVRFNKINGNFYCPNNKLTSLENCPIIVNGDFSCYDNNLISLKYCPTTIEYSFDCSDNKLTSLEGCPTTINGSFDCSYNKLTSLKGCPTTINGFFNCYYNKLISLKGCPTTINGDFNCSDNKLINLKGCPTTINGFFQCTNNLSLEDINDLDSKILNRIIKIDVFQEVFDNYFYYWIDRDFNVFNFLKDKVSDKIKNEYSHLFQANNFNLI